MKIFLKNNWQFLLFVLIGGLLGGYFAALYMYDLLPYEMLRQIQEQNITKEYLAVISMIQYGLFYGLILSCIGISISKKVNLWKKFEWNKKEVVITLIITIICSLILFPGDKLIFGPFSTWVNSQYTIQPTISKIFAGLLAGGIIEEVMLRLFLMSLIVLVISKLLYKKKEIPIIVYIIANIVATFVFAVGHIPSTIQMTSLTPVILVRCSYLMVD